MTMNVSDKQYKFIDLFCGCGGLSLGFRQAGFLPVAGIDFNEYAIQTYQKNFVEAKGICADILTLNEELIRETIGDLTDIDVIIGGPPCQGFSNANKNYVEADDPRNKLFFEFIKFVDLAKPKVIIIENDKRWGELNETCVTLQSGDVFAVPNNLYIIGTMNSADKSISLIDAALRRRFSFIEQLPNAMLVEEPLMRKVLQELNLKLVDELESTDLLVGHSYFMNRSKGDLCDVLNNNIIPLLYEYFYDNKKKVASILQETIKKSDAEIEIVDEKVGRLKVKPKGDADGAE